MQRLSDSIMLGSMLLRPKEGGGGRRVGYGCALDMAMAAVNDVRCWTQAGTLWKWLGLRYRGGCPVATCGESSLVGMKYFSGITHLFDYHVMGLKDFTLEQLVDWVRKVEPDLELVESANEEEKVEVEDGVVLETCNVG